jgi:hypothetical protein
MSFAQRLRKFRFDRPQRIAAVLLFLLFAQCYWVVRHQTLTERDYQYAHCGREMWEKPSPLAGYFTSCGNIHDGTLAYRAAGLPLTIQRILAGASSQSSPWELRHQLSYVLLLMRLPFIFCGLCLGGALWWVTRRLFGNEGGFVALALYCFSPEIVRACTYPYAEILAAFGFFAAVYTAIGVAHAMQGPRKKWRPRIFLLIAAFGFTAASHVAAVLLAFLFALGFMIYLAERRRAALIPIVFYSVLGTLLLLFASYGFRPDPFSYVFRSAAARMWVSLEPAKLFFTGIPQRRRDPRRGSRPAALRAGEAFPLLRQPRRAAGRRAVAAGGHNRSPSATLALGLAVPANVYRRRLRRRARNSAAAHLPRRDRRHFADAGGALRCVAADDCDLAEPQRLIPLIQVLGHQRNGLQRHREAI